MAGTGENTRYRPYLIINDILQMRNVDERMRREEEEGRRREERLEVKLKEEREKREKLERLKEKRRKKRKEKRKDLKHQTDEVCVRSEKNDAKLCEEDLEVSNKNYLDDTVVQTSSKLEDGPRKRSGDRKRQEVVNLLKAKEKGKCETAGKSHRNGGIQIDGTANALEAWRSPENVETKRRSMSEAKEVELSQKIPFEAAVTELLSEGEEDSVTEDESENEERILQPAISGLSLKSDHVYEAPQSLEDLVNGLDGGVDRLERNKDIVVKSLGQKMVELGLHPDTSHLSGSLILQADSPVRSSKC